MRGTRNTTLALWSTPCGRVGSLCGQSLLGCRVRKGSCIDASVRCVFSFARHSTGVHVSCCDGQIGVVGRRDITPMRYIASRTWATVITAFQRGKGCRMCGAGGAGRAESMRMQQSVYVEFFGLLQLLYVTLFAGHDLPQDLLSRSLARAQVIHYVILRHLAPTGSADAAHGRGKLARAT